MEKLSILTADILDILFEGRNKNYGAYELRKTYHKRVVYALAGTVLICLLFVGGSILANAKKANHSNELVTNIELENYKKEEQKPALPPPLPKQDPPKVEITTFTPPKIVNEEIKPNEEIKEVRELEDTRIGAINQDGAYHRFFSTLTVFSHKIVGPRVQTLNFKFAFGIRGVEMFVYGILSGIQNRVVINWIGADNHSRHGFSVFI